MITKLGVKWAFLGTNSTVRGLPGREDHLPRFYYPSFCPHRQILNPVQEFVEQYGLSDNLDPDRITYGHNG